MTALELLKDQLKASRGLFDGTVADIKQENLHVTPGGKALPLGATYSHLIFSEDIILNGMLRGITPLSESTWKDKTGLSKPMPPMDENWSTANEKWAHEVKIDLEKLKEFSKAVFAETEKYVSSLKDEDLDREIDLGDWGKKTVAYILHGMIISHTCSLAGEISVLKGLQGMKGYPF